MRFAAQKPVWASRGRRPAHAGFTRIIALDTNTIQQLIEQGLPGARVAVRGDDGVHFEALVVSEAFKGKLPLARHRLVYATLGALMVGEIHAMALRPLTLDRYSSHQAAPRPGGGAGWCRR